MSEESRGKEVNNVKLGKELLGDIKYFYEWLEEFPDDEIDEETYFDLDAQAEKWEDKFLSTVKLASKGRKVDTKVLDRASVELQKLFDKISDIF